MSPNYTITIPTRPLCLQSNVDAGMARGVVGSDP